jgi:hypothetical protein
MKNFGVLKNKEIDWSDEMKLSEALVEINLFKMINIASGSGIDVVDGILTLRCNPNIIYIEPTKEFVNEFYEYAILKIFKNKILEFKLEFFKKFNDTIYGLINKKQKQIALNSFNVIYKEVYEDVISSFDNKTSQNGIEHTLNYGKLRNLYHQYEAYKYNVLQKISGNNYLIGEETFFTHDNLFNNYDIRRELEFEIQLQIMVELNDRFDFEEDIYFTKKRLLKNLFEQNGHIFHDFETYKFTHNKIESFGAQRKAISESLYAALIKNKLIVDNRAKFIEYLLDIHKIKVSKLRQHIKKQNYEHNNRVILFDKEIETLALKKE